MGRFAGALARCLAEDGLFHRLFNGRQPVEDGSHSTGPADEVGVVDPNPMAPLQGRNLLVLDLHLFLELLKLYGLR